VYSGPGGSNMGRWATPTVAGKSVEVQRSQVDDLFKSLKSGDELIETEPRAFPPLPFKKKSLMLLYMLIHMIL